MPEKTFLNSELKRAISRNDIGYCMRLIRAGADAETSDEYGKTVMHIAVRKSDYDTVLELCLAPGFDWFSAGGRSALVLLVAGRRKSALRRVGAPRGAYRFVLCLQDCVGLENLEHISVTAGEDTLMSIAVQTFDIELVCFLREKGLPLDFTAGNSELPIFRLIKAMNMNRFRDAMTENRLLAGKLRKRAMKMLRLFCGQSSCLKSESKYCNTPLIEAIASNAPYSAIRIMVSKGAPVNGCGKNGVTPLIYASRINGSPRLARTLIECGADPCIADNFGNTAMHLGTICCNADYLAELLKACKDPDVMNRSGLTSLMIAAERGDIEKARMLLNAGANPELRDKTGKSAFDMCKNIEIMNLLSKYSASNTAK